MDRLLQSPIWRGEGILNAKRGGTPSVTVPEAPVLTLVSKTDSTITVSWPAPADGGSPITTYRLYVGGSLAVSNATSPYQLVGLDPETGYSITVSAVNAIGESPQSEPLIVTTDDAVEVDPDPPAGIEAYFGAPDAAGAIPVLFDTYDEASVALGVDERIDQISNRVSDNSDFYLGRVVSGDRESPEYLDGEMRFANDPYRRLVLNNKVEIKDRHVLMRFRIGRDNQSRIGSGSPTQQVLDFWKNSSTGVGRIGFRTTVDSSFALFTDTLSPVVDSSADWQTLEIRHTSHDDLLTMWHNGVQFYSDVSEFGFFLLDQLGNRSGTNNTPVDALTHLIVVNTDASAHDETDLEPAVLAARALLDGPFDVPEAAPEPPVYDEHAVTDQVSNHGETLDIDGVLDSGTTVDDVTWVKIAPNGAWVHDMSLELRASPDDEYLNSVPWANPPLIDGAQVSPRAKQAQGLTEWGAGFDADLAAQVPFLVRPGDTLIMAKCRTGVGDGTPGQRSGVVDQYASFVFVDDAPAAGTFAPSPMRYVGSKRADVLAEFEEIDIEAFVDGLPTPLDYSTVDTIPVAACLTYLGSHNPYFVASPTTHSNTGYQTMFPTVPDGIVGNNYGRYPGFYFSGACLHLIGDVATRQEKIDLATRLVSLGKWAWETAKHVDFTTLPADGGHWIFHQYAVLTYLLASERTAELADLLTTIPGNLAQAFEWTAPLLAKLDPHDDPTRPAVSRKREILSVSGNTIYVERHASGENDKAGSVADLYVKRLSDNATASITSQAITGGQWVLGIDQHPSPSFSANDEIIFVADYDPQLGDAGWTIKGLNYFWYWTPSAKATYLLQQNFENFVLFARAMGVWHPSWQAIEDLCVMGAMPNTPTARNDFPRLYGDSSSMLNFCRDVWDQYATELVPALAP